MTRATRNTQEDGINNPYPPIAASLSMKEDVFEEILRVFKRYDTDHDGYIGADDYTNPDGVRDTAWEKACAMYEMFMLSTQPGTFAHAGDFVQAVTYRAISLARVRPWEAVRLHPSAEDVGE